MISFHLMPQSYAYLKPRPTHWINDWQGFVVDQTSFKYGSYIHWQKNKFGRFYCLWIKIWGVWKLFPLQSNLIRSSVWSMHDDDWWLIIVIKEMIFIIMDVWCYKSMRMTKNGAIWFLSALLSSVFLCQLFLSLSSYVFVFVFVKWSNCPLVLPCGSVSVLWLLVAIVGHLLGNHLPRIRTVPRCPFLQPFGLQWSWESWWGGDYNTQYCLLLQSIPLDMWLNYNIPSRGKREPNMMWLWLWCVFVIKNHATLHSTN